MSPRRARSFRLTRAAGWLAGICACLWTSRPARAAGLPDETYHALPCRPTIACTADIVPEGSIEIEVGVLTKARDTTRTSSMPWLIKLSLLAELQLQLSTNSAYVTSDRGTKALDDATLGLKWNFLAQRGAIPEVSISAEFSAIDSSSIQADRRWAYGGQVIGYVTKDFDWLHADLNLGLNQWWLDGKSITQGLAALALSVELPAHFGVMLEHYQFSDAAPVAPKDGGVLAALTYSPKPYVTLDLGGDVATYTETRAYSLFLGMTFIAIDLWDSPREHTKKTAARHPLRF